MNNFSKRERGSDTGLYSARSLYCKQARQPRRGGGGEAWGGGACIALAGGSLPSPLRGWMDKPTMIERRSHDEQRNAAVEHCN
jgi:hypothetical protein